MYVIHRRAPILIGWKWISQKRDHVQVKSNYIDYTSKGQ
jgi:hypothetical protein